MVSSYPLVYLFFIETFPSHLPGKGHLTITLPELDCFLDWRLYGLTHV